MAKSAISPELKAKFDPMHKEMADNREAMHHVKGTNILLTMLGASVAGIGLYGLFKENSLEMNKGLAMISTIVGVAVCLTSNVASYLMNNNIKNNNIRLGDDIENLASANQPAP